MNKEQLTLGSLFDGIGGFPYAASFYGIRPLWASEIIPECISVTQKHFPEMEHVGDITKLYGGILAYRQENSLPMTIDEKYFLNNGVRKKKDSRQLDR